MATAFTKDDILLVIETYVRKHKKLPKTNELVAIMPGMEAKQIQPYLMQYIKAMPKLTVFPTGHVRDADGNPVWYRNSQGSLVLARYKEDAQIGNHVTG